MVAWPAALPMVICYCQNVHRIRSTPTRRQEMASCRSLVSCRLGYSHWPFLLASPSFRLQARAVLLEQSGPNS